MSSSGDTSPASDGYTAQLESLRSTAKWLVGASAAVGAVLVAGLQLADLGQLPPTSWRLYAALAAAVTGLSAVGFMLKETSAVLAHRWLTLGSFTDEAVDEVFNKPKRRTKEQTGLCEIERQIMRSRHELFGYAAPSIAQLHKKLRETDEAAWRDEELLSASADAHCVPGLTATQKALHAPALLRQAARDVAQCANYYSTLARFRKMRTRLGWAALVVVISSGVFAYAANPPKPPPTVQVQVRAAASTVEHSAFPELAEFYYESGYTISRTERLDFFGVHPAELDPVSSRNELFEHRPLRPRYLGAAAWIRKFMV